MPLAVHFRDRWGGFACMLADRPEEYLCRESTKTKSEVTCKKCLKKLGLSPPTPPAEKPAERPTAWDRLGSIDDSPTPAATPSRTRQDALRHRIALVFFHLMRSHIGAETVRSIADMASRGVTGQSRDFDALMPLAEQFADLILTPVHERQR